MQTYRLGSPSKVCCVTGRELKPGDGYVSVLSEENDSFLRRDCAVEAWSGPPEGTIAHWFGRIPSGTRPPKPMINDELLAECFDRLPDTSDPHRREFRYVLALLLMRRKRLRFDDVARENGVETLHLRDLKSGKRYTVTDPGLSEDRLGAVQDEVFRLLGWE